MQGFFRDVRTSLRQCIDHKEFPYIRRFCRCGPWSLRLRYLRRQIERRGCYADVGRGGWSHRWRVQRALTGPSVVAAHDVRVSLCMVGPCREEFVVVCVVLWNGGGEWEVGGKFCGPLDTVADLWSESVRVERVVVVFVLFLL